MLRLTCLLNSFLFAVILSFASAASDIRREIATNISPSASCFDIKKVRLEENGLVTLEFRKNAYHKHACPENILYNVETKPKGKIRGAKGVNGSI